MFSLVNFYKLITPGVFPGDRQGLDKMLSWTHHPDRGKCSRPVGLGVATGRVTALEQRASGQPGKVLAEKRALFGLGEQEDFPWSSGQMVP